MNQNVTKSTREFTKERNEKDTLERIESLISTAHEMGYDVSFGHIGKKTTYCLLSNGDEEIVGYTFIRNPKYSNENVGRLKAIQQAIARKEMLDQRMQDFTDSQ